MMYFVLKTTCINGVTCGSACADATGDSDTLGLYFKDEKLAKKCVKKDIEELENSKYLSNCTHTDLDADNIELKANVFGEQELVFIAEYKIEPVATLVEDECIFPDTEELVKAGTYKDKNKDDIMPFVKQAKRDQIDKIAGLANQWAAIANAGYVDPNITLS